MQKNLFPILFVLFIGCGSPQDDSTGADGVVSNGEGGNGGGNSTADPATVACQGAFKRELGCDEQMKTIEADYLSWCKDWYTCHVSAFVSDYTTAYWPCANARACFEHDDVCADSVITARYQNDPAIQEAFNACITRYNECSPNENAAFASDVCGLFGVAVPALTSQLQACLATPCEEIGDCVDQAMASFGCTDNTRPMPLPPGFPGQE